MTVTGHRKLAEGANKDSLWGHGEQKTWFPKEGMLGRKLTCSYKCTSSFDPALKTSRS